MKDPDATDPYLVLVNSNTGRLEFMREQKDGEHVVASMPGDSTDGQVLAMIQELRRQGL